MGTLLIIITLVYLMWSFLKTARIDKATFKDRVKNIKVILNEISQNLDSNICDIYLYDIDYSDALDAMMWFCQLQEHITGHCDVSKKSHEIAEIYELTKQFKAKKNPYRGIKNSVSFLLQINDTDYLIILSRALLFAKSTLPLLEIEKVTSSTPLLGDNPSDCYTPDWSNISRQCREKHHYKCQYCGVDLSSDRYLLHTHHKNMDKGDNREKNLIVLCALCHKKQPYHEQRLSVSDRDSKKIRLLRKQQGIMISNDFCGFEDFIKSNELIIPNYDINKYSEVFSLHEMLRDLWQVNLIAPHPHSVDCFYLDGLPIR